MSTQTVTRTAESDLEPNELFNILAETNNIPKWAPIFADSIEQISDKQYSVTRNGEMFNIEVSINQAAGTVDYIREMPGGKRGGAYIRVVPRPLNGSTVAMTVPIGPSTTEADVAEILEQELAALIQLAHNPS